MTELKIGDRVRISPTANVYRDPRVSVLQSERVVGTVREINPRMAFPVHVEWSHIIEVFKPGDLEPTGDPDYAAQLAAAERGYVEMRARLLMWVAEYNGKIRISSQEYRISRSAETNATLNYFTAHRNGLQEALAALDSAFPMFFKDKIDVDQAYIPLV